MQKKSIMLSMLCGISLLLGGCGGSDPAYVPELSSFNPPLIDSALPSGPFSVNMRGGDCPEGAAGSGGTQFYLEKLAGQGNVEILSSGVADSRFTPLPLVPDLGDNGWTATASTTIAVVGTEPAIGTPYLVDSDANLYIADGDMLLGNEPPVTGIHVPLGITITLDRNGALYGKPAVEIVLSNDFILAGTVKAVEHSAAQKAHLYLTCGNFLSTGAIYTAADNEGQHGGNVKITSVYNTLNHGPIVSSGGESANGDGGNAGFIEFATGDTNISGSTENTGELTALGGNSLSGNGGHGGDILFFPFLEAKNHADINAAGGIGYAGGGNGGNLYVDNYSGGFICGGNLNLSGGTLLEIAGLSATAGNGGEVWVEVYGGPITISGSVDVSGADGMVDGANAGDAGDILLVSFPAWSLRSGESVKRMADSITVSGDLNLAGGSSRSGTQGGNGGELYAKSDVSADGSAALISFIGYEQLDLSGGDGVTGGKGGQIELDLYINGDSLIPGGDLINEADLYTRGGASTSGAGGGGGDIYFLSTIVRDSLQLSNPGAMQIINSGNIDSSAGSSLGRVFNYPADRAGNVYFNYSSSALIDGVASIVNSGIITANGSTDDHSAGIGSNGGKIFLTSAAGAVSITNTLHTVGGDGGLEGGNGGEVFVYAKTEANIAADITTDGGDAGSVGGDGGDVTVAVPASTITGTISTVGGTGATQGTAGATP